MPSSHVWVEVFTRWMHDVVITSGKLETVLLWTIVIKYARIYYSFSWFMRWQACIIIIIIKKKTTFPIILSGSTKLLKYTDKPSITTNVHFLLFILLHSLSGTEKDRKRYEILRFCYDDDIYSYSVTQMIFMLVFERERKRKTPLWMRISLFSTESAGWITGRGYQ